MSDASDPKPESPEAPGVSDPGPSSPEPAAEKPAAAGSPWPALLGLLAVAAVLGFVAAFLGSDHWLWVAGAVVCGIGLFGCFIAIKENARELGGRGWLAIGYVAVISAVWFSVGLSYTQSAVHVENATARDVVLELDGNPWLTVEHGKTVQTRLPRQQHRIIIRARDNNEELDRRFVLVGSSKAYVLNVLGAQTYYRGRVEYGSMPIALGGDPDAVEVKDVWIEADVDYLFQEPPQSISVSKGTSYASKSYLTRQPVLR